MNRCVALIALVALTVAIFGVTLRLSHKSLIRSKVIQEVTFTNASEAYANWKHPPITILFNVWIFNITNAEEFANNSSTVLTFNEVGPYVYEEEKSKRIYNESEDEITYIPKSLFKFRSDLSGNLSLNDSFTTLNIPVLTLLGFDEKSQNIGPAKLRFLQNTVNGYLKSPKYSEQSTIITKTVDQLVLGTYQPEAFVLMQKFSKNFNVKIPIDFSLILEKNNTDFAGNWTVGTGVKDASTLAQLIAVNGSTVNGVWKNDSVCSRYRGTDGQQFATGVSEDTKIEIFLPDFCRPLSFSAQGESEVNGVTGISFKLNSLYNVNDESDTCYCMKDNVTDCYREGLFDIANCRYGSHIIISQPHFLNVEDDIVRAHNNISAPDELKHSSHLNIEPWTGAPLSLSIKLQLNFDLTSYPVFGRNHTKQVVPLVWFEQTARVDDKTTDHLKSLLLNKVTVLKAVANICIILPILAIVVTALHLYLKKKRTSFA